MRCAAEIARVVGAAALSLMTDLQQELAVAGELQDLRVFLAPGTQPHVVLVIDVDPVFELRPFIPLSRTAP